jgi:hypothetical protein
MLLRYLRNPYWDPQWNLNTDVDLSADVAMDDTLITTAKVTVFLGAYIGYHSFGKYMTRPNRWKFPLSVVFGLLIYGFYEVVKKQGIRHVENVYVQFALNLAL